MHPEGAVDGIAMLEEGVGHGHLIMHRAISEMKAVPEDSEVGGQGQLTISNSAPSTGAASMGDILPGSLPPKPSSPRLLPPIVDKEAAASSPAGANIDFDAEAANGGEVPKEGRGAPAK